MLRVAGTPERLIIQCDRCPIQMDLGPAVVAQRRGATPSGWLRVTEQQHLCPSCASKSDALLDFGDSPAHRADAAAS